MVVPELLRLLARGRNRRNPIRPELLVRTLRCHAATERNGLVNELIQLRRTAEWIFLARLLIRDHVSAVSRAFCQAACNAYSRTSTLLARRGLWSCLGCGLLLVRGLILREAHTRECGAGAEKCRSKESVHRVLSPSGGMWQATSDVL